MTVGVAILGCGFVADFYRQTLGRHPQLRLVGVHDRERARADALARLAGVPVYPDFAALLADDAVELVLNLTNPHAHFETTKALLEAGKHVYVEKPMAPSLGQARALVDLAEERGLLLSSAPCTAMGPPAQTLWKAVRDGAVGPVRLVYAEMEDGMVARAPTSKWINDAGAVWPAIDEFETGCTLEHAGYVLTWLCAMFGPAESVTAFAAEVQPDKIPGLRIAPAADFSVACIRFRSGVTARMTNGLYARHDHTFAVHGDEGVLTVAEPWRDDSPVMLRRYRTLRRRLLLGPARKLPMVGGADVQKRGKLRDFCRVAADMADALRDGRPPYQTARFCLHVAELTLAAHHAGHPEGRPDGAPPRHHPTLTDFPPLEPLPWAR